MPRPRTPDEILTDYDRGCRGEADVDMRGILWEVIADVGSSYELAMQGMQLGQDIIAEVNNEVGDYLASHYGDASGERLGG